MKSKPSILIMAALAAFTVCATAGPMSSPAPSLSQYKALDFQATPVNTITIPTNTTESGFFGTLVTWTTSFDMENTMFQTNDILEINSGIVNQANQNLEAYLGLRVNPLRTSSTLPGLALGATFYNDSVLGQITGVEGWFGYGITHYDFRVTPEIAVGALQDQYGKKVGRVTPGIIAEKAMSATTAASIELDLPILWSGPQNMTPTIKAGVTAKLW